MQIGTGHTCNGIDYLGARRLPSLAQHRRHFYDDELQRLTCVSATHLTLLFGGGYLSLWV